MQAEPLPGANSAMSEEDRMAAEWAAALAESSPASAPATELATEQVAPASFQNFASGASPTAGNDINMILDIPVQLTVELGRTRIPIKQRDLLRKRNTLRPNPTHPTSPPPPNLKFVPYPAAHSIRAPDSQPSTASSAGAWCSGPSCHTLPCHYYSSPESNPPRGP